MFRTKRMLEQLVIDWGEMQMKMFQIELRIAQFQDEIDEIKEPKTDGLTQKSTKKDKKVKYQTMPLRANSAKSLEEAIHRAEQKGWRVNGEIKVHTQGKAKGKWSTSMKREIKK